MSGNRFEIGVIGGGLMGSFTALFLRQAGKSVALIEKGSVGREASAVNFGNLRLQGRKAAEFPICLAAHEMWERFDKLTGEDAGFEASGHAYLAFSDAERPKLEAYASEGRAAGLKIDVLDARDVRSRWPALSTLVTGASWSPRDGVADPSRAAPAAARAAVRAGAVLFENETAERIEKSGDGLSIVTSRRTITCGHVVNAAGAWAGRLSAALGEPVPMFAAGPPIIATERVAPLKLPSLMAVDGSINLRQTPTGELITASFPRAPSSLETGAAPITAERQRRDLARLAELVPSIAGKAASRAWSGVEGYLPDLLPVIGESSTTKGVIHAFGFSGHGFQMAPAVGRLVADLIVKGKSEFQLAPFAVERYRGTIEEDERLHREFEPATIAVASPRRPAA